jgi:hypothetical protein
MNGYDLNNKLRKARRKYPLTATEQALFHELIALCNDADWDTVFSASNYELCNNLNITEKTLIVARIALINAGLVYYQCGKSKRLSGQYSFTKKLTTVKTPVDTTAQKPETPVNIPVDTTANNALSTVNIPDIYKETKLNYNKELGIRGASKKFLEQWARWEAFRIEKKKKLTPSTVESQIKFLSAYSEDEAIAIIEESIKNGWQGLFPLKPGQTPVVPMKPVKEVDYDEFYGRPPVKSAFE